MKPSNPPPHIGAASLPALDERLQLALDAGAITGTWFWDVVADRFTSDGRFAHRFSLDAARMEAGVPLAEVVQAIHPDDEPAVQQLIGRVLQVGGPYSAEYRVRQFDGSYRWIEANGKVTLDADGRATTFPGVLIDIDRRKSRETKRTALLRLGDELRAAGSLNAIVTASSLACGLALDASRAGYGTVDAAEGLVDIRHDWVRRPGDVSIAGLHRFHDFGSFIDDLRRGQVVAIADVEHDPRTARHPGAFASLGIKALLNVPLMREGELKAVLLVQDAVARSWTADEIAFVHGVADRTWAAIAAVEALDSLKALNVDLELQVEQRAADRNRLWRLTRDVMLVARFDGEVVAINPAWESVLGWGEQDVVGRSFFDLIHPDDRDRAREAARAMSDGAAFPNFDNRCRCKDGSYRWISWNATPGDGFIVAAGRDVSDAKALHLAEEQLRQSQKMEAIGQLTGGVAHDFNNLLTVISTSVALLRRETTSPDQRIRSIDAIAKTVTRAARLTSQLLAFARRQSLKPVAFDAADNVAAVAEMVGTLVGARVELETHLDRGSFIDADPGQFDTALVNLAVNARDAMDGAGRLSITVKSVDSVPAVRRHGAIAGRHVAVSVADTGCGIEADSLERIFEPFYTTKAEGHGTGLGLSQVFGFAKQSGGDVHVDSVVGRGTVFTLYFPATAASAAGQVDDVATQGVEPVAGGLALVVEDNWGVATAVETSLQELGYETLHASSAEAGLRELEHDATRFAVLFSDVVMAGMDGVTLARQVRARWPALPIVLTSGYSHVLANDAGHGFELLAKPYDLDALARTIRDAIAGRGVTPTGRRPHPPPSHTLKAMLDDAQAETRRQAELDSMRILDTPPEPAFDDLARMAAEICDTPVGLVSLIDRDRQWFKARTGIDATETPREIAFCAHAIQEPDRLMIVADATQDKRFSSNPLVTGDPNIRFYAGAPLLTSAGQALGTLCVIAPEPRELTDKQGQMLQLLADEVVKRMERRRAGLEDGAASSQDIPP